MRKTFIDKYLAGEIEQSKVYDEIEYWRSNVIDEESERITCAQFLGLSEIEFLALLESCENLDMVENYRVLLEWLQQRKSGILALKCAKENMTVINTIIDNIQKDHKKLFVPSKPETYLYYYQLILTALQSNFISEDHFETTLIKGNRIVLSVHINVNLIFIEYFFSTKDERICIKAPEGIETSFSELTQRIDRENANDILDIPISD